MNQNKSGDASERPFDLIVMPVTTKDKKLNTLPKKNDVLLVTYGYDKHLWYVRKRFGDFILIGSRGWLASNFLVWQVSDLQEHDAHIVGRCVCVWPFRFFRLLGHNK